MSAFDHSQQLGLYVVMDDVADERERQHAKWGEQNHPDGTGAYTYQLQAEEARNDCQAAAQYGVDQWALIFLEEVYEAMAESDPVKLREELVQAAAVAVAWVEAIDRRSHA